MKLISNSGRICHVEIDGIIWYMSTLEYRIMTNWTFWAWPYELKTINPLPQSCQRCKNRPVDFRHSNQRQFGTPVYPCPRTRWARVAPFFSNPSCPAGEWDD